MDEDRNYYCVEVMSYEDYPEYGSLVEQHEAENSQELGELVGTLEDEGKLDWPQEITVTKMTRLDAPMTDEQKQELEDFIDALSENDEQESCPTEKLKEHHDSDEDYEYRVTE